VERHFLACPLCALRAACIPIDAREAPRSPDAAWPDSEEVARVIARCERISVGSCWEDHASGQTPPRSSDASVRVSESGAMAGPPRTPAVPGYEIQGELGHGGMGVVYKAWQVSLERFVTLKLIRSGDRADSEERERFRIE